MVLPFDIFRVSNDGKPLWLEAEITLADAIARVRQLGALQSGRYFIHSHKTGVEISMTVWPSESFGPELGIYAEAYGIVPHRIQKSKTTSDKLRESLRVAYAIFEHRTRLAL